VARKVDAAHVLERARQRCRQIGLRRFAELLGIEAGNLSRVLGGKRKLGHRLASMINQGVVRFYGTGKI